MMELLQAIGLQHGPVAAVAAVFAYLGNKHFKADQDRFTKIETSVDAGITKVATRLDEVSDQMNANHAAILTMLISQNKKSAARAKR